MESLLLYAKRLIRYRNMFFEARLLKLSTKSQTPNLSIAKIFWTCKEDGILLLLREYIQHNIQIDLE